MLHVCFVCAYTGETPSLYHCRAARAAFSFLSRNTGDSWWPGPWMGARENYRGINVLQ